MIAIGLLFAEFVELVGLVGHFGLVGLASQRLSVGFAAEFVEEWLAQLA